MRIDKRMAKINLLHEYQEKLGHIQSEIALNRKKLTRLFEARKEINRILKKCTPKTDWKDWKVHEQLLIPEVVKKENDTYFSIAKFSRKQYTLKIERDFYEQFCETLRRELHESK